MPERGGKERRVSSLLAGVTITPREVPLEGGERVVVTFPKEEKVPEASVFLVFTGEGVPNIRRTEKINEHSVAAIAPGYATEGQVKLEVLYSVQDTTVVLFRDRLTYSKNAPRTTSQLSTEMGASQSASEENMDPKDAPHGDHGLKRGGSNIVELLTECMQCGECMGPLSSALVEELRVSLHSLSHADLAKVDSEVGARLEQGSHSARMSLVKEAPAAETTLLHVLAEYGMVCVVRHLVRLPGTSQAAIRLDQNGQMPEEVAMEKGHHQLSELLVQCRQALPCRDREARASSTSSLEGEWSTLTIRTKKRSDKTTVRLASCSQGQLVKETLEQGSFANMKAQLGDRDPGALANGEVHGDSLGKGGDIQKSTTAPPLSGDTPPPSGDTPAPSCADGVLENTPPEAARITEGEFPVISVHIPSDDGAVSNSDHSCDESTATLPAASHSAHDLPSDGETPTPDFIPAGGQWRASSIPSPDLVPLGGSVYPPGVSSHTGSRDTWRRSKSWSAVDHDEPNQLWDEEREEEEVENSPPALALDIIDGPLSITSGSYESSSSSEEENEGDNAEQQGSDTDEFTSAKEEFANSPALHRATRTRGLEKEDRSLVDEQPGEERIVQGSLPENDIPPTIVGDSESSDLANSVGSLPTDTSSDSKPEGSLLPQAPQQALSIESDMNQLSDLNVSDVDVSIGSVGEGAPDDSVNRDRGKSDPLPYSIAAAREEIEVSRSHEVLLASSAQATPTTHVPVIQESQPDDEYSPVAKQSVKRKSSRSKTNLGISSLSYSCDSGFESNISRNPSNISDSSPTHPLPVASVRRSHSAKGPSAAAEHLRASRPPLDMSTTTCQQTTEEVRANNTLPMSDRSQRTPSPAAYNLKDGHLVGLTSAGVEEDDEDPPIMYQTSVEKVVRERKLLQSSPKHHSPIHQDPSTHSDQSAADDGEQQKKPAFLNSPTSSRPLRRSAPGDSSRPHHLETSYSSSAIPQPPEGRTSPDGGRRSSIRSMLIQPSQSMNFHVATNALAEMTTSSGSNKEEPPPIRKRSGNQIERATRASISIDRPSQHIMTAHNRLSLAAGTSDSCSQSISSWSEDQVSRVSSSTIIEEREHESSAVEEEEEEGDSEEYSLSSYPELAVQQPTVWSRTVSKKTLKKLNQAERDRQALLFEWVQTERNHCRTLMLLDYGFRKSMKEKVGLSEEQLQVMFPVLEDLLAISKEFTSDLMARQEEADDGIMDTISDVVIQQFSGHRAEKMVRTFGEFASRQVYIVEHFKEHMKGKKFRRTINDCYKDPAVQRRKFPDLVQGVTSRISKYVSLMDNLLKESQRCEVDDLADVVKARELVTKVVEDVEKTVKDKTSLMELVSLQNKLEIHIPKSNVKDDKERKELKAMNFTASHRRLLRNGRAIWLGSHQRQLDVYLVLVTDFIVFLVEANGKYNIAFLQDLKPPVIRLVDIHVRVDAASRVQLLLMTKSRPEIFKLKFKNHIECERWESAILSAVEICKQEGFVCRSFAGDTSEGEESTPKAEVEADSTLPVDPKRRMLFEANQRLAATQKLLEKARFKDKPHVALQRAGSLAAADRHSRFLSGSPRVEQKGGLVGARNRAERKSGFGQKAKSIQSEEVPTEYIVCLSNMAETVQQLLNCIEKQDSTIAKLTDQLTHTRAGSDVHRASSTSVESESNLDWGDRPSVAPMNTVVEEDDGVPSSLIASFPQHGGVAMARTSSSNLCAPVRHTTGAARRPRSFHEESSSQPL